ncbi:1,2-phenylacetyl-CoA epoxidase subunit PaaC [Priestia koreensis]|uniref:Phenylacetate-CoA oxygenase n=1 Tax=Priestia koreensis TaxID=284581 RepID=A0A0M0LGW1_9BACI|nr:1,2-phenylacetyl-CoA epoxidase subunit PaaC [Priestia koreensis]KOO50320.1 phenylacetate-CoA oxygenase [Priestia koreensis]
MSEETKTFSPQQKEALVHLLFQLADDDFLFSYRGAEWLGLAPHIEEDVASASISQDSMGHATMFYQLLQELDLGKADHLAHARPASERKNSILVERVNGPGHYMDGAEYDWAYAVVRSYFYTQAKKVKIESLKQSTYAPLKEVAVRVNMELYYHLLHWKTWFVQLLTTTEEAKKRMLKAIQMVMDDWNDTFSFGDHADVMHQAGLIEEAKSLEQRWLNALDPVLTSVGVTLPAPASLSPLNGRSGQHSDDLAEALATLGEVYNTDPAASW